MTGSSATTGTFFVPLAGGVQAVYNVSSPYSTLAYYRHADWQGSSRFGSTTAGVVSYDRAYAPFGEPYAETSTTSRSYTGQTQDTKTDSTVNGTTGLYDFLFRQNSPAQGLWLVPDPAGLAAVDITNPQTWNRYAYVGNNPLSNVDPLGLDGDQPRWGSLLCSGDPIACALGGWDVCVWAGLCSPNGSGGGNSGGGGSQPSTPPSNPPSNPPSKPVTFPNETNGVPKGMNVNFAGHWAQSSLQLPAAIWDRAIRLEARSSARTMPLKSACVRPSPKSVLLLDSAL